MLIISYYKKKFASLKKQANSEMIFAICILNSLSFLYLISWHASYHTWMYADQFPLQQWQVEVLVHIPTLFFTALTMTTLSHVTRGMLYIVQISQKVVYWGILRLDMMFWKRYRKHSPISEGIWRFQIRYGQMSKQKKIRIFFVSSVVITLYMMYRGGFIFGEEILQGVV